MSSSSKCTCCNNSQTIHPLGQRAFSLRPRTSCAMELIQRTRYRHEKKKKFFFFNFFSFFQCQVDSPRQRAPLWHDCRPTPTGLVVANPVVAAEQHWRCWTSTGIPTVQFDVCCRRRVLGLFIGRPVVGILFAAWSSASVCRARGDRRERSHR